MRSPLLFALGFAVLVVASPAQAVPTSHAAAALAPPVARGGSVDGELSFFGITSPYSPYASAGTGLGLGGRYQITLVPEGLLMNPRVHDDVGLEFGLDWWHYGWSSSDPFAGNVSWSYNEIAPVVGGVWNFWLTNKLAVYPKLDLMYRVGWLSTNISGVSNPGGFGGFDAQFAAGLIYKLERVALRAEIGSYSIRFGVGF